MTHTWNLLCSQPVRPRTGSSSGYEAPKAVSKPAPSPMTLRRKQDALAKAARMKAERYVF